MARQPREVQIAALYAFRGERSGWVRTGETTAVPSLINSEIHLIDPRVVVHLLIEVRDDGKARVREFQVVPSFVTDSVTTTILRKLPVDELVRQCLEHATRTDVTPRPDIQSGAYQLGTDPEHQAWVSPKPEPGGRGRAVPGSRVRRAAEIYQQAVASGDKAPTEAVAREMGYSRPTAARDVRAAREQGLLPATPGMAVQTSGGAANEPLPADAVMGRPVWRSLDKPDVWQPLDMWVADASEMMNGDEALTKDFTTRAAAKGAKDPAAAAAIALRAYRRFGLSEFPRQTGITPTDVFIDAAILYERTAEEELAGRIQAGQDEEEAFDQIAAELHEFEARPEQ